MKLKAHISLLVLLMIRVTLDWDRQTVGDWEMRATYHAITASLAPKPERLYVRLHPLAQRRQRCGQLLF